MSGSSKNDSARATAIDAAEQVLGRVVARVARVPLGLELLVERPQRLDLHRVAHALEEPLLRAVHEPVAGFAGEHGPERREVQREPDVTLASRRCSIVSTTMNSVRPFGTSRALRAAHQVERPAVDRAGGHVLAEARRVDRRASNATASSSPRSSGSNARPSVIENPRSTSPLRLSVISSRSCRSSSGVELRRDRRTRRGSRPSRPGPPTGAGSCSACRRG